MNQTVQKTVQTQIVFLGGIPPKKNSRRWIQRGGRSFLVPSARHELWEKEELPTLRSGPKLYPPYFIEAKFYAPDLRSCDLTNAIESINDLLVKAGIIEDDNWFGLSKILLELIEVSPDNPRVELLIHSATQPTTIAQLKDRIRKQLKHLKQKLKVKLKQELMKAKSK